jgi:tetratricopeptide (TPR) repeat protein
MKTNKEDIDLIERYLDEKLDPEELSLFNQKLDKDPDFRRLFVDMDRLVEGIRLTARKTTLEEKLANLEQSLPFQKSGKEMDETPVIIMWERVKKYKVAAAAVISMLFIATFVLVTQDFSTDPGKLYAENFEPFPNYGPGNTRSSEKDDKQLAYTYYDLERYTEALEIFENLNLETVDLFYASNAYMAVGEIDKAKPLLEEVIERGTGLAVHAKWNLALCFLKEGNLVTAKSLFNDLKNQGGEYQEEASQILDKIEKIKK